MRSGRRVLAGRTARGPERRGSWPVTSQRRPPRLAARGKKAHFRWLSPQGPLPGETGPPSAAAAPPLSAGRGCSFRSAQMRLLSALRAPVVGWRERFECGGREVARWFPGHMAKGLKDMKNRLRQVDCLLEVHDARIPLSGRNPLLKEALGIRPHLLVLNKMDLAELTHKSRILECLEQQGVRHVLFTDCRKDENIKKIVPLITELVSSSQRYQRSENIESCIMVIGVPNVGKSSIINSLRRQHLRKGKGSSVGAEPGVTRSVLTQIQVCDRPIMFLLDTPGVLSPRIESVEIGLKLAVCGAIRDHLVGNEVIADYLLYSLNRQQQFSYVEHYGMAGPCDDVETVLKSIAVRLGKTHRVKVLTGTGDVTLRTPDYNAAAFDFIQTFRKGLLGKVMLD